MLNKKQEKLAKLFEEYEEYMDYLKKMEGLINELMYGKEKPEETARKLRKAAILTSDKEIADKIKNAPATKIIIGEEVKPQGEKRWSQRYDKCLLCETADHPYKSNGLCIKCYRTDRAKILKNGGSVKDFPEVSSHNPKAVTSKPAEEKHDFKDAPHSSAASDYRCNGCGIAFRSVLEEQDVNCPECSSGNIVKI